jgi:hypothetical protein
MTTDMSKTAGDRVSVSTVGSDDSPNTKAADHEPATEASIDTTAAPAPELAWSLADDETEPQRQS